MQIPSIPMPVMTGAVPQDLAAKAVPTIQATQPLTPKAVDPSAKGEKSHHSRSNKDRGDAGGNESGGDKTGEETEEGDNRLGSSVNISV